MQRQLLPHHDDERRQLRHQVGHEEYDHNHDNGADEQRIHEQFFHLRSLLVLPFQILRQGFQHRAHLAAEFTGTHEIDEHVVENLRIVPHGL